MSENPHSVPATVFHSHEIGAFLENLAVVQRCRPSTQKQALNALVFFIQEALRQEVGKIDFKRATPHRRAMVFAR